MASPADAANPMVRIDAIIAERDAEIAALRQQVAELQAWKDAVPVDAVWAVLDDSTVYLDGEVHDALWEWRDNIT